MDWLEFARQKRGSLVALFLAIALSGCASLDTAFRPMDAVCLKPSHAERLDGSEWVVVGNLIGGFGSFESEGIDDAFSIYQSCSQGPVSLATVEEFAGSMEGWAAIEVRRVDVPLVVSMHWNVAALIPRGTLELQDFDWGVPGVWIGSGNLVAARWTTDRVFVITNELCEKGEGYRECASEYESGLYNLQTGFEHKINGKPARRPVQIDTATYKRIDE